MKGIHMLCGLPRAGSTLLANVLEQHPDLWVSGTSSLSPCVQSVSQCLSNNEEVKSELSVDPQYYERYRTGMCSFAEGWYKDVNSTVIDKGRLWTSMRPLVDELWPKAKFIVCVRDPRDVIASVESRHRDTALFMQDGDQTLYESAENFMKKDAMVGGPMWHIEDLIRRQMTKNIVFVRYESFVVNPQLTMDELSDTLKLKSFKWNFKNVKNRQRDADAIWKQKFPHTGDGSVKAKIGSWRDVMDKELADKIVNVYPLYATTFGYKED